jgi:hypothetical protein
LYEERTINVRGRGPKKKGKRRHVPKITRSVLDRVRLAPKNRYYIMEGGGIDSLRGFGLEVGRAEVKYIIRKEGFPAVRLGLIHDLTPEQARDLAAVRLRDMRAAKGKVQHHDRPPVDDRGSLWEVSRGPC